MRIEVVEEVVLVLLIQLLLYPAPLQSVLEPNFPLVYQTSCGLRLLALLHYFQYLATPQYPCLKRFQQIDHKMGLSETFPRSFGKAGKNALPCRLHLHTTNRATLNCQIDDLLR